MKDKTDFPLVSIIIPTYNYAGFLHRAIQSCLNQSYKSIEIIVIDDGSTDNTKEIAESYGNMIIYIQQENSGVSSARNRGLDHAAGDYIAFLDADDYLTENAIEIRLNVLLQNPEAGAVITETYSQKNEGLSCKPRFKSDTMSDKFYEDLLLGRFPFGTCAALIRSSIAKQFRFPTGISNGEDVVYFTKIFFIAPVYYLTEPTAVTVWHSDSLRHDIGELKRQGVSLAQVIFDDPFYGGAIEHLRKDYIANRHLELFRKLYLNGDKKIAREHYGKALSLKPDRILKVDYLIKFIKACF
ncbi:MAG: glycosyltransferase family 2 protein [Proteobacteria bacterium]|nr:glycosyltransferase family 2 protein [Pseudomonadota bacterium]